MRLAKCLMAAAVLAAGVGTARANVYNYTEAVSGSWSDGNSSIDYSPQVFNNTLGALRGVALTFKGSVTVNAYDSNLAAPSPTPVPVTFLISAGIIGDGFYAGNEPAGFDPNIATATGVGVDSTVSYVQASTQMTALFIVPNAYVADYANPANAGNLGGWMNLVATDTSGLSFGGDINQFTGTLTETFTYDPRRHRHDVPEPGSLALLGTGLAMLAGILSFV